MNSKLLAISAAGALAVAAGSAHAAQIMQTQNFGPTTPNFNTNLTFNKFDGTLGTLTSVKVKVQLDVQGGFLKLDNDGVGPASGNADLGALATIASMDVPLLDAGLQPVIGPGVSVVTSSPFAVQGNDGDATNTFDDGTVDNFSMTGNAGSDMGMGIISSLFYASNYTDAIPDMTLATFGINVNVSQIFTYGSLGGIQFQGGPVSASGNVMVIYDYTPVPAPGAAGLAALGGGLLIRRRRSNTK